MSDVVNKKNISEDLDNIIGNIMKNVKISRVGKFTSQCGCCNTTVTDKDGVLNELFEKCSECQKVIDNEDLS